MIVKNVNKEQMQQALNKLNAKYDGNIAFYDGLQPVGRRLKFRLTAKSYDKAGWRKSFSGRKMKFACWHVHGDFFDILLDLFPNAVIRSQDKKIYKFCPDTEIVGNWQDWNVGSMIQPMMFSEACVDTPDHG